MKANSVSTFGKIGGYLFVLFIIVNIVNIIFLKFIPSPWMTGLWFWTCVLSVLYMVLMLWQVLPPTMAQHAGSGFLKKAFLCFALPVTFFAFAYLAIEQGIPSIFTYAMGKPGAQLATVDHADSGSRGCRKSIQIQEGGVAGDTVCGIDDTFRSLLKPGDPICLNGTKSKFGIIVETVSIPTISKC